MRMDRITLGEQLADAMIERISQGDWVDGVPGIMALGREFGVSRVVVEQGLRCLEREGWIAEAEVGKRR